MIHTQLSDWTLNSKPADPKEKARISGAEHFHYKVMSEHYFLQALQEGHGFCPLHRDQAQADQAITNIITFDFDHSTIPLPVFVEGLKIKPSFTYYSYSNGKGGLYRYRLIYVLKDTIGGYQYDEVHQYIANANHWQKCPPHKKDEPPTPEMFDTYDPLSRNQYFFSGTSISYYPDNVVQYTPAQPREHHQPAPKPAPAKKARQTPADTPTETYFTEEYKKNMARLTPHAFTQLQQEGSVFYIDHTPLPQVDADCPIIEYPANYIETPRRLWWDAANHTHFVKKWTDGEKRHRKLYMAGIIIRRLNPQLSPDELLFACAQEFSTYYDNTDKKYTMAQIIHIVERVLGADVNRELGRWKHKGYIVNGQYCDRHGISKKQVVGQQNGRRKTAEKDAKYEQIAEHYDPDKTDAQNLLTLHKAGIKCSARTLTFFKWVYGYSSPAAPKAQPANDAPQHPITPNLSFDRVYTDTDAEGIKKMLRRGLNNSAPTN